MIAMTKAKLGDTLPISTKIWNFFSGKQRKGFRPRVGILYYPKKIRINKNYTKIYLPSPQPGYREEWTKRIRTSIGVKAKYHDNLLPCNFRIENEDTCFIYLRKPHRKEILATLKVPTSNLKFRKKVYKENGWLNVRYVVEIERLSEINTQILHNYRLNIKAQHIEDHAIKQSVRRRGTAIVDTPKGILIASHHKTWLLPGGGANRGESREKAAIRELREETELRATNCKYLFEYDEPYDGRRIRNLHKVFLIEAEGKPRLNHHDVHHLAFWKPDSNIKLSPNTMRIVNRYLTEFKNK